MKYYRIHRIFKKRKGSQQNSERVTKALSQHCTCIVLFSDATCLYWLLPVHWRCACLLCVAVAADTAESAQTSSADNNCTCLLLQIPVEHGDSYIGQGIPAELFRQHKAPLIHLGFVNNKQAMVSVDENGFINTWKYQPRCLNSFSYFSVSCLNSFSYFSVSCPIFFSYFAVSCLNSFDSLA